MRSPLFRTLFRAGTVLLLATTGGCAVGPNFTPPKWLSAPAAWITGRRHGQEIAIRSRPVNAPINPEWWAIFKDPILTRLENQVAAQNLDVRAAVYRVLQSRAQLGVTRAALYPVVSGNVSGEKMKASNNGIFPLTQSAPGASPPTPGTEANGKSGSFGAGGIPSASVGPNVPPFNLFQYGFDATWELDLWGKNRRTVEAAWADQAASIWAERGAILSALSEVARDYINLRGTQDQLRIARDNVNIAEQGLRLTQERAAAGVTTDLDVANAEAQMRSTEAEIPSLASRQQSLINALSLLLGLPPRALQAELTTPYPVPPPPPEVPVGFPSELVRRRPDIRQAESRLHAAVANIGVAEANFYPDITLGGSFGFQSLKFADLWQWGARQWSIGPGLTLPIFEGGRLRYTLVLRKAEQREAAVNYQRTVLNAWGEVDNALTAFRDEQQRRLRLEQAVTQDHRALSLAQSRYQEGVADFLQVLTVERDLLSAEQQLATSTTSVSSDLVAIYNALGGGWRAAAAQVPRTHS